MFDFYTTRCQEIAFVYLDPVMDWYPSSTHTESNTVLQGWGRTGMPSRNKHTQYSILSKKDASEHETNYNQDKF